VQLRRIPVKRIFLPLIHLAMACAQLPAPNQAGVAMGHLHMRVRDVDAQTKREEGDDDDAASIPSRAPNVPAQSEPVKARATNRTRSKLALLQTPGRGFTGGAAARRTV
jgi:hypothetical protein